LEDDICCWEDAEVNQGEKVSSREGEMPSNGRQSPLAKFYPTLYEPNKGIN
jgi:hypothetical protein